LKVTFSEKESQAIYDKYHRKYKGVSRFHRWIWNNFESVPVETALGHKNLPVMGTIAMNFGVQGTIAEVTKLAIHYLANKYPKALKYIVNTVHDCIQMEVNKKDADAWISRIDEAFQYGWKVVSKTDLFKIKNIPMETEGEIRS